MNKDHDLYGLTYDCPYQQRKEDCPFKKVHHLTFNEKVRWINSLSQSIVQEITEQHHNCLKNRV